MAALRRCLLGIRHPVQVRKIAAMAANLNPSEQAVSRKFLPHSSHVGLDAPEARETPEGKRELKVSQMLFDEPHIDASALEAITAPTLVLASDHD